MENTEKPKIAFIKMGQFSYTNESVLKELNDKFAEYEIEVIDIFKDLVPLKDIRALISCMFYYGPQILTAKKSLFDTYIRTPYFIRKIKLSVKKRLNGQKYLMTFQTQSIFDASVPGIPHFLYTDHTHMENLKYPGYNKDKFLGNIWIKLEKNIYQNADCNFTMSNNIRDSIVKDYDCDPTKVSCVYCGANLYIDRNENLDPDRFDKKNILFVGIDWERKGGPVLVQAFQKVLEKYPDASLTIVGCKPKIKLKNCTIVGRVPLDEVKKFFKEASLFVLPSTNEPFGIVFLEAMALRLPVIGTKIGAIPDFIHEGKNGYLIDPGNVDMLSKKINLLLESKERSRKFGDYGYDLVWSNYTWDNTGKMLQSELRRIMKDVYQTRI